MKFPYHIDGLEYYSTILWHLKDDIALATLAHQLTEIDRKHPAVSLLYKLFIVFVFYRVGVHLVIVLV